MKKIIVLLLTFAMLVSLVSCEQSPSETTPSLQDTPTTEASSSSETTTPQETTTEQVVTPPAPYRPPIFPSELFDIAKDNPDYDPQYEEELKKQFYASARGEITIDKNILAQDDDTLLAVCVMTSWGGSAAALGAYFMHREYETWDNGTAAYDDSCYVAMTKKEIENFKGPEDWSFLFVWHPKEYRVNQKANAIMKEFEKGVDFESIPEDQKLYVEIYPYCEFSIADRVETLCEYYEIGYFPEETEEKMVIYQEIKSLCVIPNRAIIEDCGLSEIVAEQQVSLSLYGVRIYLTKAQIERVVASDLWNVIRIREKNDIPVPCDNAAFIPTEKSISMA